MEMVFLWKTRESILLLVPCPRQEDSASVRMHQETGSPQTAILPALCAGMLTPYMFSGKSFHHQVLVHRKFFIKGTANIPGVYFTTSTSGAREGMYVAQGTTSGNASQSPWSKCKQTPISADTLSQASPQFQVISVLFIGWTDSSRCWPDLYLNGTFPDRCFYASCSHLC